MTRLANVSNGATQRSGVAPFSTNYPSHSFSRHAFSVPLGNTRIKFPDKKTSREIRYGLREELRTFSTLERVRKCGATPISSRVFVKGTEAGKRAGFAGLATCGSVWACPVCSGKIARRRQEELSTCVKEADKQGYRISLLTLTMRHHKGQRLTQLWDALGYAWKKIVSGRQWQQDKETMALQGYVRTVEITHGKNGWHVHIHAVFITKTDPVATDELKERIFTRWEKALSRKGLTALKDSGGIDWQTAAIGDVEKLGTYVAKLGTSSADSLAKEATLGQFKKAKGENRTPFQILADIIKNGDMDDVELWWEYEGASKGKRALTWSRGLRNQFGIGEEKTDEEIAAEEVGDVPLVSFDSADWTSIRPYAALILDVCEEEGVRGLYAFLDSIEAQYERLTSHPPK